MSDKQRIDAGNIVRILPHKQPSVVIDRVTEIDPGARIVTQKCVSLCDPSVNGRFPGLPLLPESVMIEAMIQSSCLLAYATEQFDPSSKVCRLVGINKTKFYRSVRPGDTLEIEANLKYKRSNVWRFSVAIFESDTRIAEAELGLSLHDREDVI